MPSLRDVPQAKAARAFLALGGVDRSSTKNYRMIKLPNGALIQLPSGTLKIGLLAAQIRRAGLTVEEFRGAL